jgi:dihydroorotase
MKCDVLIRGGEVIDPAQDLRGLRDVAVADGRVLRIADCLHDVEAAATIDARGLYVVPGLIDLHVHVYPHATWGLDPDSLCPANGVTTMLDAGTAGSYSFEQFRRETIDRARTRVFALVNLSCTGLLTGNLGELLDRRYADVEGVKRILRQHPDVAIGVKIRASREHIGDGEHGWANLRDAIRAARESETWLMVHIGDCPMSIPELVRELAPGDCVTHCFRQSETAIVNDDGRISEAVGAAAERGVLFDVGHGAGSFSWDIVEASLHDGFEPSTISTDLHRFCINGPVYDLPTTMSKFLTLGVPLERVIEMSTTRPAAILKQSDQLGTLREGTIADIALLENMEGRFQFTDSHGNHRIGKSLLRAAVTIRGGEIVPGGGSLCSRQFADEGFPV